MSDKQVVRMTPKARKRQLLDAAVELAKVHGADKITRVMVADATGTSEGLVNRYFTDRDGLRAAVKRARRGK